MMSVCVCACLHACECVCVCVLRFKVCVLASGDDLHMISVLLISQVIEKRDSLLNLP